jgi:hypothetical protein
MVRHVVLSDVRYKSAAPKVWHQARTDASFVVTVVKLRSQLTMAARQLPDRHRDTGPEPRHEHICLHAKVHQLRLLWYADPFPHDRNGNGSFMRASSPMKPCPKFCKDWSAPTGWMKCWGRGNPTAMFLPIRWKRCSKKWGVAFHAADADAVYEAVPTWGPHDDVPGGLSKICDTIPLVILSNAMNSQIMSNVGMLGATFHRVYTAESAQAYKPRMQAFEYMFDVSWAWGRKWACTCPPASAMTRTPQPIWVWLPRVHRARARTVERELPRCGNPAHRRTSGRGRPLMLSRRVLLGSMAAGAVLSPADRLTGKPRTGGRIRVAGIVASTADTLDPAKGEIPAITCGCSCFTAA